MQGVNNLIIYSAHETKFDPNALLARVRDLSTSFADDVCTCCAILFHAHSVTDNDQI